MTLKQFFLGTKGRINRIEFLVGALGVVAATLYAHLGFEVLFVFLSKMAVFPLNLSDLRNYSLSATLLVIAIPFSAIAAKRMHDWGSTGIIAAANLCLAIFILSLGEFRLPFFASYENPIFSLFMCGLFSLNAIVTLYISVMCFLLPGEPNRNGHGQIPRRTSSVESTQRPHPSRIDQVISGL